MEVTITNENFESYKNGELPLVVDFWATWCAPCRMIAPIIAELAEEYDGKVVVGKCDVEEADEIASQFGIRHIHGGNNCMMVTDLFIVNYLFCMDRNMSGISVDCQII